MKPLQNLKLKPVRSKRKKKKKRTKDPQRKEKKATKTLGIVLGIVVRFICSLIVFVPACFLVCWVPFFTCNILDAISIKFSLNTSPGNVAFQVKYKLYLAEPTLEVYVPVPKVTKMNSQF